MSSVTREQIIGLLKVAACPASCDNGVVVRDQLHGEIEQCQFCFEREKAIADLQAAEPVVYQRRMRPTWDSRHPWLNWEDCSKGTYDDCLRVPFLHDWEHQVRALFTLPCPPTKAQGEPYGYVYDGQLLCDEQDFADYFDGAQYDISTMTPVYTAPPAPTAVPDGWRAGSLVTVNQEEYPGLGAFFTQIWDMDKDEVVARVYGDSHSQIRERIDAMLTASPASDPDVCTPAMEAAAEKYWKERRFKGLSEDPRTWKGLYKAMCAARQQEEAER